MKLTAVSMELVIVEDDMGIRVCALMSDDSIVTVSTPYGAPDKPAKSWMRHPLDGEWRFKTKEELVELARAHNTCRRLAQNNALHDSKVSRLGWDYAARGY